MLSTELSSVKLWWKGEKILLGNKNLTYENVKSVTPNFKENIKKQTRVADADNNSNSNVTRRTVLSCHSVHQ